MVQILMSKLKVTVISFSWFFSFFNYINKGIINNTNLKSISASGHSLDSSSISKLGSALAEIYESNEKQHSGNMSFRTKGVVNIALGDRNLGDSGIIALCQSLEKCNGGYLTKVDLELKKM